MVRILEHTKARISQIFRKITQTSTFTHQLNTQKKRGGCIACILHDMSRNMRNEETKRNLHNKGAVRRTGAVFWRKDNQTEKVISSDVCRIWTERQKKKSPCARRQS